MFKSFWHKGYEWHEKGIIRNGYTLAIMYSHYKIEAGSLAASQLASGYRASRRNREQALERQTHA